MARRKAAAGRASEISQSLVRIAAYYDLSLDELKAVANGSTPLSAEAAARQERIMGTLAGTKQDHGDSTLIVGDEATAVKESAGAEAAAPATAAMAAAAAPATAAMVATAPPATAPPVTALPVTAGADTAQGIAERGGGEEANEEEANDVDTLVQAMLDDLQETGGVRPELDIDPEKVRAHRIMEEVARRRAAKGQAATTTRQKADAIFDKFDADAE